MTGVQTCALPIFFESVTNDLMVGEFGCLNALKTLNCDEEERMIFVSLLYKRLKTGGFYPAQISKRNTVRWIKTPPLDV